MTDYYYCQFFPLYLLYRITYLFRENSINYGVYMPRTIVPGYRNKNNQVVIRRTDKRGNIFQRDYYHETFLK